METAFDYWMENQERWATMLIVANDISAMYGLPTIEEAEIRRMGGWRTLKMVWWKDPETGRSRIGFNYNDHRRSIDREECNMKSSEDKSLCMQCIVGVLHERMHLSTLELDIVLGLSRGTVSDLLALWKKESTDFKRMIFGLSGDMRSAAFRHLVLGTFSCRSKS